MGAHDDSVDQGTQLKTEHERKPRYFKRRLAQGRIDERLNFMWMTQRERETDRDRDRERRIKENLFQH